MARRQVSIFINGREVANQMKSLRAEKRKLTNELNNMTIGTKEYEDKVKDLRKVNDIIDGHRKKIKNVESSWDKMKGAVGKFGAIAATAITVDAIVGYGAELFNLASEMELLTAKAETVFGEALPQVTRAAEENAFAMGLTVSEYTDAAAAIGDLLIPMGFARNESAEISTNLVDLSGALSEWTGGQVSAAEVTDILGKAMLGEREQLKGLGIAISEADVKNRLAEKGLKNLTGEMLQQAKAAATLELITEKSTDAQAAFVENSGTFVRRQAEMSAKISEISEKLATALVPVFERLLTVADGLVDVIATVAEAFGDLFDQAGAATRGFEEQRSAVVDLEKNLNPLLSRYEELSGKTEKTEEEQQELKKVIAQIGEIVPTAVTEFGEYGEVLGISADKAREFVEAQRLLLQQKNAKAIKENKEQLEDYNDQVSRLREQLSTRNEEGDIIKVITSMRKAGGDFETTREEVKLTADEIRAMQAELAKLEKSITTTGNAVKLLEGFDITQPETPVSESSTPSGPAAEELAAAAAKAEREKKAAEEAAKRREKEAERAAKDQQRRLERLLEIQADFEEQARLQALSAEDRKIAELEAKFDEQIAKAIELEAQGVAEATAARLELERLKDQQVRELREQLDQAALEEKLAKEQERTDAEIEANLERIQQQANAEKEFRDFLKGEQEASLAEARALELEQLEFQYENMVALAQQHGLDLDDLLIAYRQNKKAINAKFDKEDQKEATKAQQETLKALQKSYADAATIITSTMDTLAAIGVKNAGLQKALALAEIGINTAKAIAAGVASASSVPFPGNLAAIATTIATVVGNMATASKILSGADIPQKKKGSWHNVTGQDDNTSYRAEYIGSPASGMLPSHPVVLASEAGAEYFVANKDLSNPYVLNHVRAIENITRGRRMPQYNEGGFSDGTIPTSEGNERNNDTNEAMLAVLSDLVRILENGIFAMIDDDTIVDIRTKFNELNAAAGGTLE